MSMSDEKLRILKMVENGKITAEEGVKLIEAIATAYTSSNLHNLAKLINKRKQSA